MIMQVVYFPIQPAKKAAFIEFLTPGIEASNAEDGVGLYELVWGGPDGNTAILLEEYDSQEVLDSHLATEHVQAFLGGLPDYLSRTASIRVYDANGVTVNDL